LKIRFGNVALNSQGNVCAIKETKNKYIPPAALIKKFSFQAAAMRSPDLWYLLSTFTINEHPNSVEVAASIAT